MTRLDTELASLRREVAELGNLVIRLSRIVREYDVTIRAGLATIEELQAGLNRAIERFDEPGDSWRR